MAHHLRAWAHRTAILDGERNMGTSKKKTAPKPTVSGVLRETIREKGLTAYAAAKKSGVSVDAVQRFLKDERGLTLGTVDKLAGSLGLTLCPDDKPAGGGE